MRQSSPRPGRKRGPETVITAVATALAILIGTVGLAPQASAYSLNGRHWAKPLSGTNYYCPQSSVSRHTNWVNLIDTDIRQYNNLRLTKAPQWSRNCAASTYAIQFVQVTLDAQYCGYNVSAYTSTGMMINSTEKYTTRKTFYDSATNQGSSTNCSFQWTTLHEFGHSQGLGHSTVSSAVMYPNDNNQRGLQTDDINGLWAIYR